MDREFKEEIDKNIELHRKMWMEISKICVDLYYGRIQLPIEEDCHKQILDIKTRALSNLNLDSPNNSMCFACQVANIVTDDSPLYTCLAGCPFNWGAVKSFWRKCNDPQTIYHHRGLIKDQSVFYRFKHCLIKKEYSKASELALKIANLPVREWNEKHNYFK